MTYPGTAAAPSFGLGPSRSLWEAEDAGEPVDMITDGVPPDDRSIVLSQRLWDLTSATREAASPDWDGYGALAVSDLTFRRAVEFLSALSPLVPAPDIAADPDGEISFTWRRSKSQVFTVSIGASGRLSYAGLFGPESEHGTRYFVDEIPDSVERGLARLFPSGT